MQQTHSPRRTTPCRASSAKSVDGRPPRTHWLVFKQLVAGLAAATPGGIAILSICLAAASPAALADHLAETVSVTAPRIDNTLPDIESARMRIQQTPGGVDVIDGERIRDGRASTLADALRGSPGVFAESRFGAEEARLSIRGSGLQRTFHGRGLLLLQDGVPLNLADGSFDMQAIEPLATRYIEVYRGANATPYGATTLGGAINFVSLNGRDAPGLHARAEAGSFGYRRASAGYGFARGDLDGFVSASEFYQDGYRDHARQNSQRAFGNLGYDFGGGVRTRFFFAGVNTESELPGNLTRAEFRADPRKANTAPGTGNVALDQERNFQLWRVSNRTTWQMTAGTHLEWVSYGAVKQLFHPIFQVITQDSTDYGVQLRLGQSGHLLGRPNQIIVGALANQGSLDEDRFQNVRGAAGMRTDMARLQSSNAGVFVENQFQATEALAVIAGGHYTRSRRERRDLFGTIENVDSSFDRWSPRIGLRLAVSPTADLFANWSGSFEPPSLSEAGNNLASATPLPNRAQRGGTLEVGSRGSAHLGNYQLSWDLALYRAELRNELLAVGLPGNATSTATINADRTIHQGVEAGIRLVRGAWAWTTSATLNDFRFDGDTTYGDNRIAGLPSAFGFSELRWNGPGGWYVAPAIQAAARTLVDHANTLDAPGYAVVNLRVGQRPETGWGWFAEARNLLDHHHIVTTGVVRDIRIAGTNPAQFLPGDGFAVYAGLEYRPKP
jgi:iron complex outermembrane receptor protein